ncbi:MAG: S-methyl-5'-thioinosine phosphorylase [Methanobacteriota archaeon]|nr:MAG: S-methyl-5'-thioinosine phosphorylase [Euryarchaeota archaeon]
MKRIGLIGGTGLFGFTTDNPELISPWNLEKSTKIIVETAFGDVPITVFDIKKDDGDCKIFFLQRHHDIDGGTKTPHKINHLANVSAMISCNVEFTIAVCSVGAIGKNFLPGMVGLADQYIDFSGNSVSFCKDDAKFTSMTNPFDESLNFELLKSLRESQPNLSHLEDDDFMLTYWFSPGPQFETPAEINAISKLGGDCVGMTLAPEAKLMAEKEHPFSAILIAGNHAAGLDPSDPNAELDHEKISSKATSKSNPVWYSLSKLFG